MSKRIMEMLDLFYANKHLNKMLYKRKERNDMKENLVWNVYCEDINRREFEKYNIFNHGSFKEYVDKIFKDFKKSKDKEAFGDRLRRELFYYFGSKYEWEVVITNKNNRIIMVPLSSRQDISLDVTDDADFDWFGFYDYMKKKNYADKDGSIKIDVYEQVRYRWKEFVNYCWNNR